MCINAECVGLRGLGVVGSNVCAYYKTTMRDVKLCFFAFHHKIMKWSWLSPKPSVNSYWLLKLKYSEYSISYSKLHLQGLPWSESNCISVVTPNFQVHLFSVSTNSSKQLDREDLLGKMHKEGALNLWAYIIILLLGWVSGICVIHWIM